MTRMHKFWKKVYFLAVAKCKEAHMQEHHNDTKCPGCKEWMSITGLKHEHKHEYREPEDPGQLSYYASTCGQCNTTTKWTPDIAPFLVRLDENNEPISD